MVINQNSLIIIGNPDLEIPQQPSISIVFICYYFTFTFLQLSFHQNIFSHSIN